MSIGRGRLVLPLLLAAGGASAALVLALGAGLTFVGDEWTLLLNRRGFTPEAFLDPHNEHLLLLPIAIYKALQATFGMESTLPFRVVATPMLLLSAALLFVYLRRCVGDWLAMLATIIVLFLGAAWEILLWPINIGFSGSMAAGLGMLLALKREDRTGDVLACALLAVSIAFTSLGLVFVAGAATEIGLRGGRRLARGYVVAVPLFLFGLWYVGWGHAAESAISLENALTAPRFMIEGLGSSVAGLLGLFALKGAFTESLRLAGALLLALGAVVTALWLGRSGRLRDLRDTKVSRWFWVVAVIGLAFWLIAAINETPGRTPSASRYMYPGAIFVLLLLAEWFHGVRVGRRAAIVISVLAAVSLVGNLDTLIDGKRFLERASELASAELGAVAIARAHVHPAFRPANVPLGTQRLENVAAGPYLSAVDAFGSSADDPAELSARPEPTRAAADVVLARALGLRLDFSTAADAVDARRASRDRGLRQGGCTTSEPADVQSSGVPIPNGLVGLRAAPGTPIRVRLRRFATESFPVDLGSLTGGSWTVLQVPSDGAPSQAWELATVPSRRITICELGA
jgi:hypothetical protein